MSKYPNGRLRTRAGNGRFRKTRMQDFGIGGVCPTPGCGHFLLWQYDGDPRDAFPDPRNFRYRCFTCEPLTELELKRDAEIQAAKPKEKTMGDFFREIAERVKSEKC